MISLNLDWHEVLWYFAGGMAGNHLRWSVYEDMVNKVWPQCSEQERRNLWLVMRRDLGTYWRPDGWSGHSHMNDKGEGPWKPLKGYTIDREDADGKPVAYIMDETPWMYFRQVLARFDPDNQWAVTMPVHNAKELDGVLRLTPDATIISRPKIPRTAAKYDAWHSDTATVTVRAYKWKDLEGRDAYFIDWSRRCDPDRITKVEPISIPDDKTM